MTTEKDRQMTDLEKARNYVLGAPRNFTIFEIIAAALKAERDSILAEVVPVLEEMLEDMDDAAGCVQLMKDGYDNETLGGFDPFDRLRALRHSFNGREGVGKRARELLEKLKGLK